MRDYSIELARIAAGIITDVMGGNNPVTVSYSADGNNIIFTMDKYPLYGKFYTGKVFAQTPCSTFSVRKGIVSNPNVAQAQFRYYEGKIGNPLSNPHVYNDGHPCWAGGAKTRFVDLICNIIETFTCANVTRDSVFVGRCASGVMGVGDDALRNSAKHHKKVMETMGCKSMVNNKLEMERYVSARWSTLLTIFMKTM